MICSPIFAEVGVRRPRDRPIRVSVQLLYALSFLNAWTLLGLGKSPAIVCGGAGRQRIMMPCLKVILLLMYLRTQNLTGQN
jgi:hypothetical protein